MYLHTHAKLWACKQVTCTCYTAMTYGKEKKVPGVLLANLSS